MADIQHKTTGVKIKTRKNGVNLASAALPHMSSFKEESDDFFFSDIYTRVCLDGS